MVLNHNTINLTESQKRLGNVLDSRLDFKDHLEIIFKRVAKTIKLLRKLQNLLPRKSLITVYKSFMRPNLDYRDIIYDQVYNPSFYRKLDSIQYNDVLAITSAIRGTSAKKLYLELCFESLQQRPWHRNFDIFIKCLRNSLKLSFQTDTQAERKACNKELKSHYSVYN